MDAFGYILLGFAICLSLVFGVYFLSVWYLDWYNRVHLPKLDPEIIVNGDVTMCVAWVYDPAKKIAEKVVLWEYDGTHNKGAPTTVAQTYDHKGNIKP